MATERLNLVAQWVPLELVFNTAVDRLRRQDPESNINWERTENFVRIGALSVACAILEDAGQKGKNEHLKVLFEIRNALIHNDGDLKKNTNRNAENLVVQYFSEEKYKEISRNLTEPYVSIHESVVKLNAGINFALRLLMRDLSSA